MAEYYHNRIAPKGGDRLVVKSQPLFPQYPRLDAMTESQDTVNVKMGYCDLGVENSLTHVAANETYHASHLHIRRHAEYFQMKNGDVYFVNKKGQIGYISTNDIARSRPPTLLEHAENYFSWSAGVNPEVGFESLSIKCDKYEGTGPLFDAGNDAIKHPQGNHTLKRPIFYRSSIQRIINQDFKPDDVSIQDGFIGFQTSENTCSIYGNGHCIYHGEYDGRRFPVAYNYRDGRFFDFRHPDQDGSGVCQSIYNIPALDENGKIIWKIPNEPVVYEGIPGVDFPNDPNAVDAYNLNRYPSPEPVLNSIPLNLSLVWHWWTAIHPMSVVRGGLVHHPHTEPGYYTTGYKRYFSFHLVKQDRCPPKANELEGEAGCSQYDFTGSYFGDLAADESTFKGIRLLNQDSGGNELDGDETATVLKVSDVTLLSVDAGLWLMTPTRPVGDNCPEDTESPMSVPRQDSACTVDPPSCGHYRTSMAVRIASDNNVECRHYDFPSDVPLHNQIRGFVCDLIDDGQKARIVTRQKLFTCSHETRRITSRQNTGCINAEYLPKPMPFNWSLAEELRVDPDNGQLSLQTFASMAHNDHNFPKWWQRYIETFYLYQSQPLAAHLVRLFNNTFFSHENCEYATDQSTGNRVLHCYDKEGNEIEQDFSSSGTTPPGYTEYNQPDFGFFDYVNDVAKQQFMQIRTEDMLKPGCYMPLWMHLEPYERKETQSFDIVGPKDIADNNRRIYHPLPWYTFRFDQLENEGQTLITSEKYYTSVFDRTTRGSVMPTSIPNGIKSGSNELYTLIDGMYVLDVPSIGTDFTVSDDGANAVYGITPYDVIEVGDDNVPQSWNKWFMYNGSELVQGDGSYQEYLDYSRREHRKVISLEYKAGDFEYTNNAGGSHGGTGQNSTSGGNSSSSHSASGNNSGGISSCGWTTGGVGTSISGDQGMSLSMDAGGLGASSFIQDSFVTSDGTRLTSENEMAKGWSTDNIKSEGWEWNEPHATVEHYEDFSYVKGNYYRRLYFKGDPVYEMPEAIALGYDDNTVYEFAFVTKNEFVLFHPMGACVDAYMLQVWNLARDEQGRIKSCRHSLAHTFEGIEQYAVIASTIVVSDHYLCFATQVYWREFFRMYKDEKISIYDYTSYDPADINPHQGKWTDEWKNLLDTTASNDKGISESGIPVMKKDEENDNKYFVLTERGYVNEHDIHIPGLGYYAINDTPEDVFFGADHQRLRTISVNMNDEKTGDTDNSEGDDIGSSGSEKIEIGNAVTRSNINYQNRSSINYQPMYNVAVTGSIGVVEYPQMFSAGFNLSMSNTGETGTGDAIPNMHKFMCFYRECPTDDFIVVNPSGEPEFVDRLCHMSPKGVRLNVSITRKFATIWNTDTFWGTDTTTGATPRDRVAILADWRVPLIVYKGEWLAYPTCRYVSKGSSSGFEFIFDTETVSFEGTDGKNKELRRQLSLCYTTSGGDSNSAALPHMRIVYWQGNGDYYWDNEGNDNEYTDAKGPHIIIDNVLWHRGFVLNKNRGNNTPAYEWKASGLTKNQIENNEWSMHRTDLVDGCRAAYSIVDETEWRIWFNQYIKDTRTGVYEQDILDIYQDCLNAKEVLPFGSFNFEIEVLWQRTAEVYPLILKHATLSRFDLIKVGDDGSEGYNSGLLDHVVYEAYTFDDRISFLHLYEAWAVYENVLYIRYGKGWRQMVPPMEIEELGFGFIIKNPKELKICSGYAGGYTVEGVVDRVLYFIDNKDRKIIRIHVGVFLTDGRTNNEWIWGSIELTKKGSNTNTGETGAIGDTDISGETGSTGDTVDAGSTDDPIEHLFNIPTKPLVNINGLHVEFVTGGVVIKDTFTKIGNNDGSNGYGDCNCKDGTCTPVKGTVDVIFKDGCVARRDKMNQSSAKYMKCCEWYELINNNWELKRQPGVSCLDLGITISEIEDQNNPGVMIGELNPIFTVSPSYTPVVQISNGNASGTHPPRSVPCDTYNIENKCPDGSDCNSDPDKPGLCADGTPCPGSIGQGW